MIRRSKLTVQWQSLLPKADDFALLAGPRGVIVYKPGPDNLWPGVPTIGRPILPGGDGQEHEYIWKGRPGAHEYFERWVKPQMTEAPHVKIWLAPNEPHPMQDLEFRLHLGQFTDELCDLYHGFRLPGETEGRKIVTGCFSTGWPDVGTCIDMPGVFEKADWWCLHSYAYAHLMQSHAMFHHRAIYAELQAMEIPRPCIIGEIGLWEGGEGWDKTLGGRWNDYKDMLIQYDLALQQDPYVWFAAIFVCGANKTWKSFEVNEEQLMDLGGYIKSSGYVDVTPPPPPPPPDIERTIALEAQNHVIPLNPAAAFEKYAAQYMWLPASREFDITVGSITYRAQVYRQEWQRDKQFILYAIVGDWDHIKVIEWAN